MKRQLLGTTALVVAAGVFTLASTSPAEAQQKVEPIKITVGGYHQQFLSYVSQKDFAPVQNGTGTTGPASGKFVKTDVTSDSEIHFNGRTTLDNGITIGLRVELEANTQTGDQIDESYLIIDSKFGRAEIGTLNNVHYRMYIGAPEALGRGFVVNDPEFFANFFNSTRSSTSDSTFGVVASRFFDNDGEKINLYTPRIQGFQLGFTYVPDSSQDQQAPVPASIAYTRGIAVAGNFVRSFGPLDVSAYAGYFGWQGPQATFDGTPAPDPKHYSFGGKLGFAGFEVGGGYGKIRNGRTGSSGTNAPSAAGTANRRVDGEAWELGAQYTFGPATVSLDYFNGRNNSSLVVGPDRGDDKFTALALEGSYVIGPGISIEAGIFTAQTKSNDPAAATTGGAGGAAARGNNKANGAGVGLLLKF